MFKLLVGGNVGPLLVGGLLGGGPNPEGEDIGG